MASKQTCHSEENASSERSKTSKPYRKGQRRCSDYTPRTDQAWCDDRIGNVTGQVVRTVASCTSPDDLFFQASTAPAQRLVCYAIAMVTDFLWHIQAQKKYTYIWQCVRVWVSERYLNRTSNIYSAPVEIPAYPTELLLARRVAMGVAGAVVLTRYNLSKVAISKVAIAIQSSLFCSRFRYVYGAWKYLLHISVSVAVEDIYRYLGMVTAFS